MQMAPNLKNAARVVEHPVKCQTQFIQIEAGGVAQGVKKADIHTRSLSQTRLAQAGKRRNFPATFQGNRSAIRFTG